jgi:hypothetical protein
MEETAMPVLQKSREATVDRRRLLLGAAGTLATAGVAGATAGSARAQEDPAAFEGRFRIARAEGRFSGSELGFEFRAEGTSTPPAFAELGSERNGVFL